MRREAALVAAILADGPAAARRRDALVELGFAARLGALLELGDGFDARRDGAGALRSLACDALAGGGASGGERAAHAVAQACAASLARLQAISSLLRAADPCAVAYALDLLGLVLAHAPEGAARVEEVASRRRALSRRGRSSESGAASFSSRAGGRSRGAVARVSRRWRAR